jgi:hypothetical protein
LIENAAALLWYCEINGRGDQLALTSGGSSVGMVRPQENDLKYKPYALCYHVKIKQMSSIALNLSKLSHSFVTKASL